MGDSVLEQGPNSIENVGLDFGFVIWLEDNYTKDLNLFSYQNSSKQFAIELGPRKRGRARGWIFTNFLL